MVTNRLWREGGREAVSPKEKHWGKQMEIVGVDRLAYESERLIHSSFPGIPELEGIAAAALVLWIAIGGVFSALALWGGIHRRREQNVGPRRPSALRFAAGYSRRFLLPALSQACRPKDPLRQQSQANRFGLSFLY